MEAALSQLGTDLAGAVPSYLAMSVTIVTSTQPVTFTVTREGLAAPDVRSSLQIPVDLLIESEPGSTLTLFATAEGAFAELAAELGKTSAKLRASIVLDAHLHPQPQNRSSGVSALASIHQAIGVLIAAGFDPDDAQAELESIARRASVDLESAARDILTATQTRDADD